ncbi:DUF4339 domain-containing protein [Luteimonas sp. SJ-92]|uniref:DUF4339 domain-containing protein n=1 Tax=Luteimonas salinisoli TaxID=2752307 RepID=A0A853JAZ9_9GAMM|nr:DUF4339 domain-containing protein [Luteimonas salinisoli]NZA25829.1 DUF4339 domain-containing protein [Luteimonas salinisoli]
MDRMYDTQGRDRDPAPWHYADPQGNHFGPYPAAALVRLFQFGHIRPETPVWRGDPGEARPLRDCTATFQIGPGSRIRLVPPPPAPPGHAPASVGAAEPAPLARAHVPHGCDAECAPESGPATTAAASRSDPTLVGESDPLQASGARTPGPAAAPGPVSRRRILAAAIVAAVLAVTAVALRFAT